MTSTPTDPFRQCFNCQTELRTRHTCPSCGRPVVITDLQYLNNIERLAQQLIETAYLSALPLDVEADHDENRDPLLISLEDLARELKHWHYPGDGCTE